MNERPTSVEFEVRFARLERTALSRPDETVLDVARRAGAPIGNSCGGTGVCGRCRVTVLDGADHLAPRTSIESRTAATRGFDAGERLACQAIVRGPCTIVTDYW